MALQRWFDRAVRQSGGGAIAGAPKTWGLTVVRDEWRQAAEHMAVHGGRLLSLWASRDHNGDDVVRAAYTALPGVLVLSLPLTNIDYPSIEQWFPAANRMQRAVADLSGLRATDSDARPWLRHAAWPAGFHPLIHINTPPSPAVPAIDDYAFVPVAGDGVHEIPVGPVHAGIIEPGHFRFSVVGEKVLRLEERLGYVHKGIERRFGELPMLGGHRLAARVSGDSAVAFSWAYCQALEGMAAANLPPRVAWLRALALELERLANHLGDLGAIGNDAGFSFGLAQFARMKEDWVRLNDHVFGHRYLMDQIVPGGVRRDVDPHFVPAILLQCDRIEAQVSIMQKIYQD